MKNYLYFILFLPEHYRLNCKCDTISSDLFLMNFVCILCGSTPGQIQYGGFKRALAKKSGDMIRDRVRILYLLFL